MQAPVLHSDYHFILNCYSTEDITAVIEDMQMFMQGYKFLYAIDTYDIVENYLPYTKLELFSANDRNFQAQKYICYDYFFGEFNNTSTILLDEYRIELVAAKNKLNRHLKDAQIVLKNMEHLKKETDGFLRHPEKTESFMRNHFEMILILLILNDKTHSIFDEFLSFLKHRLNTQEVAADNDHDKEIINDIFLSSRPTKFAAELFETYVDAIKGSLASKEDRDSVHIFLENTYRDIEAIERVCKVNSSLEHSNLKYKVIYLSSAKKTVDIFKIMSTKNLNPNSIDSKERNSFNRNIYQYFLFDRLKTEFENNPQDAIQVLEELKDLMKKISSVNQNLASKESTPDHSQLLRIIKRLFDEKSGILDNHFYFSVYERYKVTFSNLSRSEELSPINKSEMMSMLNEIDRNKESYLARIFTIDLALSQLNQTYEIVDTFTELDNYEPAYRYGKDIVRNPYQHLPTLLLMADKFESKLKRKLYHFLNYNVEMTDVTRSKLKTLIKEVVSELSAIDNDNLTSKFLRSIVITYLNFVAQRKVSGDEKTDMEESIISDLQKQYEIIVAQFNRIDLERTNSTGKLQYHNVKGDLLTEIMYVLIWLYRRNLREEEGISKGLSHIKVYGSDARIYQGIGLCYVSKSYLANTDGDEGLSGRLSSIDLALRYLKIAQDEFKTVLNVEIKDETSSLIVKNYIALLNSIADLNLRRYERQSPHSDQSFLQSARFCIEEIKVLFNLIDLLYDEHLTYSLTEIEIEYYEAVEFHRSGQMSNAHLSIISALNRQVRIKQLINNNPYVDQRFILNDSLLNDLNSKILSHYSKFRK